MTDIALQEPETVDDVTPEESPDAAVEESTTPLETDAPSETDTPPDDGDADGDPDAPAATTPPDPEPEPEPTPYEARVMGTKYAAKDLGLAGAHVRPDGTVEIPAEASPRLAQLISKGRMYEERVPQQLHEAREQVRQAQSQFHEKAERGEQLYSFFESLVSQGEQAIYDFLHDWSTNQPKLQAHVELELAKAQRARMTQPASASAPAAYNLPIEMIEQQAEEVAWTEALALVPKHKGLTREDAQEIGAKLWRNKGLYLAVADRDYPEANVVRGQPVFNTAKWREDFADRAEERTKAHRTLASATRTAPKVKAAAARNANAIAGTSGTSAPPPPPAGAASAANASAKSRTKAEYDAKMLAKYGRRPR